ncbi:hypothetical protein [Lysinibacillus sp. TE18511]
MGFNDRGTKAKSITSCDTCMTNIVLARDPGAQSKRLIGRPHDSAQSQRKSALHYGGEQK